MSEETQPKIETDIDAEPLPETTPETGQTGQEVKGREPLFEIAQDIEGKWHWVLFAGNGRPIATSAVAYDRRNDCLGSIKAARAMIGDTRRVVYAN